MKVPLPTPRSFWLTILSFTIIVNLVMMRSTYLHLLEINANLMRSAWSGVIVLCLTLVVVCAWLMLGYSKLESQVFERLDRFHSNKAPWRMAGATIFLAVLFLIPYIKFKFEIGQNVKNPVYDPVLLSLLYYWTCWWAVLFAVTALKTALRTSWMGGFLSTLVLLGIAYEIMIRINVVTTYPFSLGWSEGSRYYYASLLFSNQIYGEPVPLSPYHPSRYILQSIPFLIPNLGIFAHRFWQFLLWVGLTAGASIALAYRAVDPGRKQLCWLFAGWSFLFFLRVGVYYHLQVMVILVLLGVSQKHPWRSLFTIILASLWAGISRVNWFVMPAMMAIAIYVLETPLPRGVPSTFRKLIAYFSLPAVWSVAGVLSAFVAQAGYVILSGNADNARAFTSSFTSDLLWYRLLPNASYPLGIIAGILVFSGPLLVGLLFTTQSRWTALHPIRWITLYIMMLGLFVGSMIVSVKIGGGGDLHNTDTYSILLSIIAAYFIGQKVQADFGEIENWGIQRPPLIAIAAVIPILFIIPDLSPYPHYKEDRNQQAFQQLVDTVENVKKQGPVLFVSERQMVTFGDVDVRLEPDYELIILMEMAMSGNQAYLDRFYTDLEGHRFAAIVTGRQNLGIQEEGAFFEENNAWNSKVAPYILCYYEPSVVIDAELKSIIVFTPRLVPECPMQ